MLDLIDELAESADKLQKELEVLVFNNPDLKYTVTHDCDETLMVYAPRLVKPYLPKIYDGWDVSFIESPNGEIEINLDQQIDFLI